MFYAHKGSSNDNAFTTINGEPTRQFYAFSTKAERQAFQDKVWKESGQKANVIFCTAQFVKETLGTSRPYVVWSGDLAGRVFRSSEEVEHLMRF